MKCPKCGQVTENVHFKYVTLQQKSDEDRATMTCGCVATRKEDRKAFLALEKAKGKLNARKRSPIRRPG